MMTKKVSALCYGITFLVFLAIFLWGTFGVPPGDEMGFSLLNFYLLMPCVSFVAALVLGAQNARAKWIYPIFAGILGFAVPALVFGGVDWISLFFSFIPSVAGLGIGVFVRALRAKKP